MSIEDLVTRIQNGETKYKNELWERIYRFVYVLCNHYLPYAKDNGYEWGDLIGWAWLGIECAIKEYNPDKGFKFISYLRYHTRNAVFRGMGMNRKKRPVILSIDQTIDENEKLNMLDVIEDEQAYESFDEADSALMLPIVWSFVDKLDQKQANVIKEIFIHKKTLTGIGKTLNVSTSYVGQIKNQALRNLRKMQKLREYYYDLAYHQISLKTFTRTRTSSTEFAAIKHMEAQERQH